LLLTGKKALLLTGKKALLLTGEKSFAFDWGKKALLLTGKKALGLTMKKSFAFDWEKSIGFGSKIRIRKNANHFFICIRFLNNFGGCRINGISICR
jgi:hypothetical protein